MKQTKSNLLKRPLPSTSLLLSPLLPRSGFLRPERPQLSETLTRDTGEAAVSGPLPGAPAGTKGAHHPGEGEHTAQVVWRSGCAEGGDRHHAPLTAAQRKA